MIYKNKNMLLLLYCYIWYAVHISNVRSEITSHSTNSTIYNNYDVTTIYRMTNTSIKTINGVGFKDPGFYETYSNNSYSIEIHSRTNAIGLPITAEVGWFSNYSVTETPRDRSILQINNSVFFKCGLAQNNNRVKVDYVPNNWETKTISITGKVIKCDDKDELIEEVCINASEYRYDLQSIHYNNDYYTFFSILWTHDKGPNMGISITYIHKLLSLMDIYLNIMCYGNGSLIRFTKLPKFDGIRTMTFNDMDLMKNQEYMISFKMKMINSDNSRNNKRGRYNYGYTGLWFGLVRIAESSYDGEDVRIVYNSKYEPPNSFDVLGNYKDIESLRYSKCLNGGYKLSELNECICPPGFIGKSCETGCGPNAYGLDCNGVCSMHANVMCRGMYMCTKSGCTCPPGLTGPLCNEDCTVGTYGADCKQLCSSNCYNSMCDQYTGVCSYGCSPGYVLPYCLQKNPYLMNPPKLLSIKYESMEIQCDFQPSNVMSENKYTKFKYYQIVYKTLKEDTFTYSEIKPIDANKNVTNETLIDLKSDAVYMIGVLLITDDGNFNDQDVVYGQYKTTCDPPNIDDFNVVLKSGIKSINVTWNKITNSTKKFECNIVEYILMLSYNQSQNQISGVQKIITNSISGHSIYELIPGYQYNVQLVLNTTGGHLVPLSIHSATPLIGKEFKIKDIFAVTENGRIKVSWKLGYIYDRYNATTKSVLNEPVTCILRYKIKRILSCTLKELEYNWTSLTIFNQTNYEIPNAVPNSQYAIQVSIADDDTSSVQQKKLMYTLTPSSKPNVAPNIEIENPMNITNSSVFIQWKFDFKNCSKLNGFFSKFFIELEEKSDNYLQVKETKQNNILFEDLKPNTTYELKVYIKTHIGYSSQHFLFLNFTTIVGILVPVDDLMVYRRSLNNRVIGLRWHYLDDSNLDGFIITYYNDDSSISHENNVTIIPPKECLAWPEYYCQTFFDLSAGKNYTFKIQPRSLDYPEGGLSSSITFENIDGDRLPDPPSNIRIIEVGNTTISVQWDIPWVFNGVLQMFIVNVEENIPLIDKSRCCVNIAPIEIPFDEEVASYNYTATGLVPGSKYSIEVLSVTESLWYSPPAKVKAITINADDV